MAFANALLRAGGATGAAAIGLVRGGWLSGPGRRSCTLDPPPRDSRHRVAGPRAPSMAGTEHLHGTPGRDGGPHRILQVFHAADHAGLTADGRIPSNQMCRSTLLSTFPLLQATPAQTFVHIIVEDVASSLAVTDWIWRFFFRTGSSSTTAKSLFCPLCKTTLLKILAGKHMVGGRDVVRVLNGSAFHDTQFMCSGDLSYLGGSWSRTIGCAMPAFIQIVYKEL